MRRDDIELYLCSLLQEPVRVNKLAHLGGKPGDLETKAYGYGTPVRVDYETADGEPRHAVIHTISPGDFGHEHMADRAQILLWQHRAFNSLPRHVRALDVAGFGPDGEITSVGHVNEFCLVTEYLEGDTYARDLERIAATGETRPCDLARADALADYLIDIHRKPKDEPGLYTRRIRELVGHGECLMGLIDSFPDDGVVPQEVLRGIEHRAVEWRWRLKNRVHRLRQVHGDFHPWNILFQKGAEFHLLDRSRGEYGDPADDVACLTANYLFFSLRSAGRLEGSFNELFHRFWDRYLNRSGDLEILEAAPPFFTFRSLVMASPVWYPNLDESVRRKLISFATAVLDAPSFNPDEVNHYCAA